MSISSFDPNRSGIPLAPPCGGDAALEVMSRMAAQAILMGQQGFHLAARHAASDIASETSAADESWDDGVAFDDGAGEH